MKKIYTLITAVVISTGAFAQCVINPSAHSSATAYGIVPDSATGLPTAYVGTPYVVDLQINVAPDTTTQVGTFDINWVRIDSVTGLPSGFTYLPNPSNGVILTTSNSGTGFGCVALTGNPVSGQEMGGPNSDGVYPVVVYFTAEVQVFTSAQEFPSTEDDYIVRIVDPNSVPSAITYDYNVAQASPNPADQNTGFNITVPGASPVQFTLYNMLGGVVKQETISATRGVNRYTLATSALPAGAYMCMFRMGDEVVTRRITVSH
jgi:hypothetical protein